VSLQVAHAAEMRSRLTQRHVFCADHYFWITHKTTRFTRGNIVNFHFIASCNIMAPSSKRNRATSDVDVKSKKFKSAQSLSAETIIAVNTPIQKKNEDGEPYWDVSRDSH
jgi:hypothetical protein